MTIPIHWKKSNIPTREQWIAGVNAIREAKEWIATCRGLREKHLAIWAPWNEFSPDPRWVPSSLDAALLELADPSLKARRSVGAER